MYFGEINGIHHMYIGGTAVLNQLVRMSDPDTKIPNGGTAFYFWPSYYTNIFEGPWIHEHNGTYYLMTSIENAKGTGYRLSYATAASPEGPWTFQTLERDDAFLRQSDLESIWGPGHHCMIEDSNGTKWVYYQQKDNAASNWQRSIAVDPLWIDASGRIHMRPTRGQSRPGPGSAPTAIWPVVAASLKIEAETYAGSAYTVLASGGSNKVVEFRDSGGFVAFRNVDFGGGKDGFSVTLSCPQGGAMPSSLEIRLDGVDEPVVGALSLTQTAGFVQLNGKLNQTVSGVHDVIIRGYGALVNNSPFLLDHLTFTNQGSGSVNRPPIAVKDAVQTPMDQAVSISVLGNDTDPNGHSLTVTAAGHSGNNTNNQSYKGGTLSVAGNVVTYTPSGNYWGEDVFFYSVRDREGLFTRGQVSVDVLPPTTVNVITNGLMVVEAESFFESLPMQDSVQFSVASSQAGYVGSGYVTTPDLGLGRIGKATRLTYALDVPKAEEGIYSLWVRVLSPDSDSDSVAFSFSRRPMVYEAEDAHRHIPLDKPASGQWVWVKDSQALSLSEGVYKMSLWRDYDGQLVDRFLLSADPTFDPSTVNGGQGPDAGRPAAVSLDLDVEFEAEDLDGQQGVGVIAGDRINSINDGDWVRYDDFDFGNGADSISVWASAKFRSGTIKLRLDTTTGPLIGSVVVDRTFSWNPFVEFTGVIDPTLARDVHDLFFVFEGDSGSLMDIDSFEFSSVSGGAPTTNDLGRVFQAEDANQLQGINKYPSAQPTKIGNIQQGDSALFQGIKFGPGAKSFTMALASPTGGGTVEFRITSATGPKIGTANIVATNGWDDFAEVSENLSAPTTGVHDVYLVFTGNGTLVDIDWFQFNPDLVSSPTFLYSEDFTGGAGAFSNASTATVGGEEAGAVAVPYSGSVTCKDELGTEAIPVTVGDTLQVRYDVMFAADIVATVDTRSVLEFNLGAGGQTTVNAAYLALDDLLAGEWVTCETTITVPNGAATINDVRLRFNGPSGAGTPPQSAYIDNVVISQ